MVKETIGLLGTDVMGQNLGLNIGGYNLDDPSNGWPLVAWNRTKKKKDKYLERIASEPCAQNISGADTIEQLVDKVGKKGIYWLMVKVTDQPRDAVDDVLEALVPHLEEGALIIDGGNTHFTKTMRREEFYAKKGIRYIGTGVSGGEEGALLGPAYMPGCTAETWKRVEPLFNMTAAKAEQDNEPCVHRCGPNGAGHFVKMVHNAIEYGDMAMIGESVWLLNKLLGWDMQRIGKKLEEWNGGEDVLKSYLIEITAMGLQEPGKQEEKYLADRVADITRMKGTGLWACREANRTEFKVPVPTWYAALQSRLMSMMKDERVAMSEKIEVDDIREQVKLGDLSEDEIATKIHNALYVGKIASYAQGIDLLQKASEFYSWDLNINNIARGWRGGCIIRAEFLDDIAKAYSGDAPDNLIADPFFTEAIVKSMADLQYVSALGSLAGVPIPTLDASRHYIGQMSSKVLKSAQVQALERDVFGRHHYLRLKGNGTLLRADTEYGTAWMEPGRPESSRPLTH